MPSNQPIRPAFHVRFIIDRPGGVPPADGPEQVDVEVAADKPLNALDGEDGSLLQIALSAGVEIEHACGGVGACATCHVIVEQGFDHLAPADENEEDVLEGAAGLTRHSRLACRAVPTGAGDLVVRVPAWNRNA